MSQKAFCFVTGEMNPEDFRRIFQIVTVFLRLAGGVQNHISLKNFMNLPVYGKKSFAGTNIQKLIVRKAKRPPGTHGRKRDQPVNAAAVNTKGCSEVFQLRIA